MLPAFLAFCLRPHHARVTLVLLHSFELMRINPGGLQALIGKLLLIKYDRPVALCWISTCQGPRGRVACNGSICDVIAARQ